MPRRLVLVGVPLSRRPLPILFRNFLVLPLLALLIWGVVCPAAAQSPPDNGGSIAVVVTTDKVVYAPGEPVRIRIGAKNLTAMEQVLQFSSSLQADYIVDGWRWSNNKAFLTVMTSITIPPGGTYRFPEFVHTPGDFYLAEGSHQLVAEVGSYGRAEVTFAVGNSDQEPRQFLLSPMVSPNPAPFGTPVELAVTVTNVSTTTLTFGHDGCPVLFTIDSSWSPPLACPEYWNQVTLEPGESIAFDRSEYPYLVIENTPDFVLGPGWHYIEFQVPGVGVTAVRFEVTGSAGAGAIAGHVFHENGQAIERALVEAFPFGADDSTGVRNSWNGWKAVTGADGSYRIEQVPAGIYAVRAYDWSSGEVWYDGRPDRSQADPVTVTENGVTEGIDFVLPSYPPPPQYDAIITGHVFDDPGMTDRPSRPLPQAVVAAIALVNAVPVDSGWVPPDDSTGVGLGRSGLSPRGMDDPTRPPYPGGTPGPIYYGFPDSLGQYTIHLPLGFYKVIAFAPGYEYEWWQETPWFAEADSVAAQAMWAESIPPSINFSLLPVPAATLTATIAGLVTGVSGSATPPTPGGAAADTLLTGAGPLAGAKVTAVPLVQDPRLMTFRAEIYTAVTGDDGSYAMTVPPTWPWIVNAAADGYEIQFYDHVPDPFLATPVDVQPGATTANIDFELGSWGPPPGLGIISGAVYSDNPLIDGPVGPPLPGAVVRLFSAAESWPFEMVTRTDAEGRFTFFGLPVSPDGSMGYRVSAEAPGHIPAYFPRAFEWAAADVVVPGTPLSRVAPVVIHLPVQVVSGPYFAVGLVRSSDTGIIVVPPPGDPATGGSGSGGSGGSGDNSGSSSAGGTPPDSIPPYYPLAGAYLYLVDADRSDTPPLAGGVACDNGTLVLNNLPAGRYRAYADRPGFGKEWFHGTNRLDAAVITLGPGIDPVVIDIQLTPLAAPPPFGGGGDETGEAEARIVTDIRNAPNPFKPQTTIIYRLMDAADVSMAIYDINGRLVRRIFDNVRQTSGEQRVPWDGRTDSGEPAGAGIYFYRIATPNQTSTGKMVMIR